MGMSHCAPEATLKPKRFEFTLKTVITDVFVAQVYWEAVPKKDVARRQQSFCQRRVQETTVQLLTSNRPRVPQCTALQTNKRTDKRHY